MTTLPRLACAHAEQRLDLKHGYWSDGDYHGDETGKLIRTRHTSMDKFQRDQAP